jgi:HNH endonuclease
LNPFYSQVASRAAHRCEYCFAPEVIYNFVFEVDHILPLAKRGKSELANLALACRSCNLYKGKAVAALDLETNKLMPFFQPRQDRWEEHFRVNEQTCLLEGLTAKGKVTIFALKLTSQSQVSARRQWLRLGIYP